MKLTTATITHLIEFIRNRQVGNSHAVGKHQAWLKNKLKKDYSAALLRHGALTETGISQF